MLTHAYLPLDVSAMMVVLPGATPVTTPAEDTLATLALPVIQTMLSVLSSGVFTADSLTVSRTFSVAWFGETDTAVAGAHTVTTQVAVLPLGVCAWIVALPARSAVILPFFTATTEGSLLLHVIGAPVLNGHWYATS